MLEKVDFCFIVAWEIGVIENRPVSSVLSSLHLKIFNLIDFPLYQSPLLRGTDPWGV